MLAAATGADYERAIGSLAACPQVDAIIVIFTPPLVTEAADVQEAIHSAAAALPRPIPVLSVFMSKETAPRVVRSGTSSVPYYPFPEDAARSLALAARYAAWRALPDEELITPDGTDRDRAAAIIASALARQDGWMPPEAVTELAGCYGIPLVRTEYAATPREAERVARELGGAVALKAIAPGVLHKTDAGGVRLALRTPASVRRAATAMAEAFATSGHTIERFQLQPMVEPGVEMIVGVVQDENFGPVLACGAGGTATELLKDVSVRITPITRGDAERMVRELKTFPLLDGYRGAPKADVPALEDVLLRVSAMVDALPQIAEMDLNPLIVHTNGAVVVDARIRLEPAMGRKPLGAR
jgi:acyl-CoA synthetase (NDP forming)